MNSLDDLADHANALWSGSRHAVIGTQSVAQPGYPFGSIVPYALDRSGQPLLLLSPLSQHTKNIEAERRCCLTVNAQGAGDVQQLARLTALGEVSRVDPGDDIARYFRYFPHARPYYDELGFVFYRFAATRMHWNGGFATARWLDSGRVIHPNPFDPATETGIVEHMNADHRDALRHYLVGATTSPTGNDAVEMLGIDGTGIDLRAGDQMPRVLLIRAISSATEAREVLVDMARSDT